MYVLGGGDAFWEKAAEEVSYCLLCCFGVKAYSGNFEIIHMKASGLVIKSQILESGSASSPLSVMEFDVVMLGNFLNISFPSFKVDTTS